MAQVLAVLGGISLFSGDLGAARAYLEESLREAEVCGHERLRGDAHSFLSDLERLCGAYEKAAWHSRQNLRLSWHSAEDFRPDAVASALEGVVEALVAVGTSLAPPGAFPAAAMLLGLAAQVRKDYQQESSHPVNIGWRDEAAAGLRAALGCEEFAAAFARGRHLPLEGVVQALLAGSWELPA